MKKFLPLLLLLVFGCKRPEQKPITISYVVNCADCMASYSDENGIITDVHVKSSLLVKFPYSKKFQWAVAASNINTWGQVETVILSDETTLKKSVATDLAVSEIVY